MKGPQVHLDSKASLVEAKRVRCGEDFNLRFHKYLRLFKLLWECNLRTLISENFLVGGDHIHTEHMFISSMFSTECNIRID